MTLPPRVTTATLLSSTRCNCATVVTIAAGLASCRTNARRSSGVLMSIGK